MRALELGRPLLRATNNGITAAVTADGKEQARLPQFEQGVLTAEVPLVQGRTLYSLWNDWPLLAISLLCVGLLSFRRYQLTKQAK